MTFNSTVHRWLAVMAAVCLLGAACAGDGDGSGDSDGGVGTSAGGDATDRPDSADTAGLLAGVCPDPLVIQTDWFPESEHGALYHLITDAEIMPGRKAVRGQMTLDGVDLGIEFEIRSGGPAAGRSPVSSLMYTDDSIHLGYASTDTQIAEWATAPLVSVVAPLEKNPQIIMWDPETYPDVNEIADLRDANVTVNVFPNTVYAEVFINRGILSAEQIDESYDGGPARFIAEDGKIAQQGFASSEVYTYEHIHEDWGKPVAFQLLHDAGFEIYPQTIGVRPDDIEDLRPCLRLAVPVFQQAVISYDASPSRANEIIVDAVEQFESAWVYSPELADYSTRAQREHGLIGNGPDTTVGNIEPGRIQGVIDEMRSTELWGPLDLSVEDLYTNEFIDTGIGFE